MKIWDRDRFTPPVARPIHPTRGATDLLHLARDRFTPLKARPIDPTKGGTKVPSDQG